ncbi:uncharacterized protein LOC136753579 [Amia ocellicauda]
MWMALMGLTVLCVTIQILGVARQSRNDKVLKQFANKKFLNMRFKFEFQKTMTTTQQGIEVPPDKFPFIKHTQHRSRETTLNEGQTKRTEKLRHGNNTTKEAESLMDSPPPVTQDDSRPIISVQIFSPTQQAIRPIKKSTTAMTPEKPKELKKETTAARGEGIVKTSLRSSLGSNGMKYTGPLKSTDPNTSELPFQPGSLVRPLERKVTLRQVVSHSAKKNKTVSSRVPTKTLSSISVQASDDHFPASLVINPKKDKMLQTKVLHSQASVFSAATSVQQNLLSKNSSTMIKSTALKPDRGVVSTCQAKTHIVFLKTHKTASSTILNILYRFGDSRNLTFALPLSRHNQLFYPLYFAAPFVEGFRSKTVKGYDIMCNHMRFLASEVKKVMPQDSFYFSILRNPITMMESIFSYYKSIPSFNKVQNLDEFLTSPWQHYNASLTNNHYAKNLLTFDFGFNNNGNDSQRYTNMTIVMIEQKFHLILISEYFDESMILLKNALCWTLDDVVSFKLNSRSNKTRKELSPQAMEKIKQWNSLDWKIYMHFNATFWRRIDETMGRDEMKQEVARLQERRRQLMKTCLQEGGAVDPSQIKDTSLKPFQYGASVIQGYNLNPHLDPVTRKWCQSLITPELQYTVVLYDKQFPDLAAKLTATENRSSRDQARTNHSRNWESKKALTSQRRNNQYGPRNHVRVLYQKDLTNWTTPSSLQNVP